MRGNGRVSGGLVVRPVRVRSAPTARPRPPAQTRAARLGMTEDQTHSFGRIERRCAGLVERGTCARMRGHDNFRTSSLEQTELCEPRPEACAVGMRAGLLCQEDE